MSILLGLLVRRLLDPRSSVSDSLECWIEPSEDFDRKSGAGGITQAVEFILPRRCAKVDPVILIIRQDSAQICLILVGGRCSSMLMELTVRPRKSMV